TEAHRADTQLVSLFHDPGFEPRQSLVGVDIVKGAEELALRQLIPVCAIAPDADAHGAGRAALSLRLPNRMQDALADALQIAVGASEMVQVARHRILNVLVLAAAALQDEFDLDLILFPLLEVHYRRLVTEI